MGGQSEHRRDAGAPLGDAAVSVALAEFAALRAEITNRTTAQAALVGVGLTALGVIVGLVVKEGGDERLLLAIPPLAFLVSVLRAGESYRISVMGDYIRTTLWPYLKAADDRLPSWQQSVAERRRSRWNIPLSLLIDGPATALFVIASVVALVAVDNVGSALKTAGWLLTVFAVLPPVILGLVVRARAAKGPTSP